MQTSKHRIGTGHQDKPSIDNARVFISYSRKDGEEFAKDLRAFLINKNIPLWQDRLGMEGGRDWWLQITDALNKVEFMVLVMTPKAMESPIIRKEWRYARQIGVCVYPVKGVSDRELEYASLPRWMDSVHFYDLNYERDKFINDLNTRCRELRVPFMVDDLPQNFVQRPKEFNDLIDQLLDVEREEPLAITTSIRGAGGYGKTTLAMALCHDERVQDAYDDGILWVTLGEKPGDLTEKIKNLIEILSGNRPGFTDEGSAAFHLSELLADRDILIVIDDVWNSEHVEPFLRGGTRCSRLITTRNSDTLPIKCRQNILDAMQTDESLSLICHELPPSNKEELQYLSQRLGKWPLVLKMVNAFLIERVVNRGQSLSKAIAYVIKRLGKYGITAFDDQNDKSRWKTVEGTIGVSLELLNEEEKDRFNELAIFIDDILIPLETVEKLWISAGLDDLDTEDLCERLFKFSLLLHFDPSTHMIRLHNVIRSYLRRRNEHQLPIMHAKFLDSYGVDQWADLPNTEPYLWDNLAYHLVDSGERSRLKNLLFDYSWIRGKLIARDVNVLLSDYDYFPDDKELLLVQQALRLSSNQLNYYPDQLSPQLIGRLDHIKTPKILKLLGNATENQKGPWFRPMYNSLVRAGGPLQQTLKDIMSLFTSVAISPDGKTAVSGSQGDMADLILGFPTGKARNTLNLWDLSSGKTIHTFDGCSSWISSVAISPDGKTAVSGSWDKTLKLWDLSSGKALRTLEGHSDSVHAVAISPDGKTAVSGSSDKTLKLWDLSSGKALRTLEGHSDSVHAVAISPDGKTAVSGSSDKTLKLWDLSSGKAVQTLGSHAEGVKAVAISPDGKTAISGSDDETLKLWNLCIDKLPQPIKGHIGEVLAVAISPDGKTAASSSKDYIIRLWDLSTGETIRAINLPDLYFCKYFKAVQPPPEFDLSLLRAVAISPDCKSALSNSEYNPILWDLSSGKVVQTLESYRDWVAAVAISMDGKTAVSSSKEIISNNHILELWDLSSGKALRTLEGHSDSVHAVAISPDGKTAVSGSSDKTLKLWDLSSGKVMTSFFGESAFVELTISPCGRVIFAGDRSGRVYFLRLEGV